MQIASKYQHLAKSKEAHLTPGHCRGSLSTGDVRIQPLLNVAMALLQLQNHCSEQLMERPMCTTHRALKKVWCCTGIVKLKQFGTQE